MTLAIGKATILGIVGIVAIAAGAIVLQRARRVGRQVFSLASSMADRRFVFKVDAPTEATLPSRFNRGANAPPRPAISLPRSVTSHSLADELDALELPPGPGSVGLAHRRRLEPNGPPAGPPARIVPAAAVPAAAVPAAAEAAPVDAGAATAPADDGVQEHLPLGFGASPADSATGPDTPAPAPVAVGPPAKVDAAASPFPAGGLRWRNPDATAPPAPVVAPAPAPAEASESPEPVEASPPPAPAEATGPPTATAPPDGAAPPTPAVPSPPGGAEHPPSPGDGAPDFATLVREYIRALRWKVD